MTGERCYCGPHARLGHPVDASITPEEFAVESPYGLEAIRATFLVLQHAGLRVVRESEALEREAIFAAHLDSCGKRIAELEAALSRIAFEVQALDHTIVLGGRGHGQIHEPTREAALAVIVAVRAEAMA